MLPGIPSYPVEEWRCPVNVSVQGYSGCKWSRGDRRDSEYQLPWGDASSSPAPPSTPRGVDVARVRLAGGGRWWTVLQQHDLSTPSSLALCGDAARGLRKEADVATPGASQRLRGHWARDEMGAARATAKAPTEACPRGGLEGREHPRAEPRARRGGAQQAGVRARRAARGRRRVHLTER